MWPARNLARWINGCDEHGSPGPGRTHMDVAFYTALYSVAEIVILVILFVALLMSAVQTLF